MLGIESVHKVEPTALQLKTKKEFKRVATAMSERRQTPRGSACQYWWRGPIDLVLGALEGHSYL